jgi:2'-5' RNA ligase
MPRRRLGVVLFVPDPAAAEVQGLRRACGDGMLDRVPPHLTLVPPVNVPEADLSAALAVVRAAAGTSEPFTLELGPPATFAPAAPVVYLEVGGALDALHALRDAVFRPPLERPMTFPFVPHVTLADDMAEARIAATCAALTDYRVTVEIEAVHVLEEGPGRLWAAISDPPLGRPVVVGRGGLPIELTRGAVVDPEAAALSPVAGAPAGTTPVVVTARRESRVVGVLQGWTGPDSSDITRVDIAAEAANDEIDRHLLAMFSAALKA